MVMLSDIVSNMFFDLCSQEGLEAKVSGADLVKFMNRRR